MYELESYDIWFEMRFNNKIHPKIRIGASKALLLYRSLMIELPESFS